MCHGRKRPKRSINFNRLLPDGEVFVDVEGTTKPAVVKIVDPFLEILTVECGNEEVLVSFDDVLLPPEEPAVPPKKKRAAALSASPRAPQSTPPPPPPVLEPFVMAPQFATVVRSDGSRKSCGDLVSLSPSCREVLFVVLELYGGGTDQDIILQAQNCQISDGVAIGLTSNFTLTCPVTAFCTVDGVRPSSHLKKLLVDVRRESLLRSSQSLRLHVTNRTYQLQVRKYDLAAKLRAETQRSLSTKAARTVTIKLGPADLRTDLELFELAMENHFKVEKTKERLAHLDALLGEKSDVKLKQDDRFFYVTYTEFALDKIMQSRSLIVNLKFAESICAFRPDSYREDTAADCC